MEESLPDEAVDKPNFDLENGLSNFLNGINEITSIMKKIMLEIPDNLDLDDKEAAMLLAGKLYEQGRLSLGQAASLAGYSKRTFMELLGNYNISVFNYPVEELDNDIKNAQKYHR